MTRTARIERETRETRVEVEVDLDRAADPSVATGLGFLDHMWTALGFHSGIALCVRTNGDLEVDDHHTAEDTALAIGEAISTALGDRAGIERFGNAYAPLDEALARAVVDLSGRPYSHVDLGLVRPTIGTVATENLTHTFRSLAVAMRATLHVDVLRGENDHHRSEAAFKAVALALRQATTLRARADARVPSTKGALT